ncbi:Ig-like domain-containing protein [Brochothrix campestris]|uniref:LysM domain-containing protein n=1 Tax=Brochothrix campestris FSL F6-1037 TaxID=1265861 RepID=W7CXF4_9LIST|nr:Ig-like domain-containing protein [Brochothrix campestris]EUJ41657.1 LysM domain-containing protein [Brochothrix campestris FSL F6-1037]
MKKIKRSIVLALVIIAAFFQNPVVFAKNITSSIVTDVNFKADTTANGGQIITEIDSSKKFILSYEFSIPKELIVLGGDRASFSVPPEIRYNNIDMTDVPLKTSDGLIFGTASIKNGQVEITFNTNVEQGISMAYFDIWANFNANNITIDEMNVIPFETINGTVEKEILITQSNTGSGSGAWITKNGKYEGKQDPKDTLT